MKGVTQMDKHTHMDDHLTLTFTECFSVLQLVVLVQSYTGFSLVIITTAVRSCCLTTNVHM